MYRTIEIKKNDFVKYLKCIYLVKDFEKLDNGRYRLSYFFRSIIKDDAKLHFNEFYDISAYLTEKIKKPSLEETKFLISRIKAEHPSFDLSFVKLDKNINEKKLNENECIEYLKSKGYIVYKQV
jgi:hypothetical protein